jgi:hypothetical protein
MAEPLRVHLTGTRNRGRTMCGHPGARRITAIPRDVTCADCWYIAGIVGRDLTRRGHRPVTGDLDLDPSAELADWLAGLVAEILTSCTDLEVERHRIADRTLPGLEVRDRDDGSTVVVHFDRGLDTPQRPVDLDLGGSGRYL